MAFRILRGRQFKLYSIFFIAFIFINTFIQKSNFKVELRDVNVLKQDILAPKYIKYQAPLLFEGFSYENWRDSDLLPRVLTIKNHQDFMNLIEIVANIFAINKLEYMLGKFYFLLNGYNGNRIIYTNKQ
jgi:hypothetical protein